ncbi:MAG: hypothetical protein HFG54_01320 [Lachnospiraceae bacterium]|jgi:hypothetical protein|nr:hypothetical protein [Lachnospiraceae bacterium]
MDDLMQCYRISSNFRMIGSLLIEDVELYLTVCGTERCTANQEKNMIGCIVDMV